jgi:hypothetical protein
MSHEANSNEGGDFLFPSSKVIAVSIPSPGRNG